MSASKPDRTLATRSDAAELMDTDCRDEADYQACLRDLAKVNTVTLARRPTLAWLDRATRVRRPGEAISVFDVAFGGGDMLRAIARWGERRGRPVRLGGVDLNPAAAGVARAASPGLDLHLLTGDVLHTIPDPAPDYITSSLFTHHLSDAQVVEFLRWMERHARRGWLVNDLQRHPVAYHGFRAISWAAGWHRFVRHDGAVSVARAFTRAEWLRLLAEAGVPGRCVGICRSGCAWNACADAGGRCGRWPGGGLRRLPAGPRRSPRHPDRARRRAAAQDVRRVHQRRGGGLVARPGHRPGAAWRRPDRGGPADPWSPDGRKPPAVPGRRPVPLRAGRVAAGASRHAGRRHPPGRAGPRGGCGLGADRPRRCGGRCGAARDRQAGPAGAGTAAAATAGSADRLKIHVRLHPAQREAVRGHVEVVGFDGGYGGLQLIEHDEANLCILIDRAHVMPGAPSWDGLMALLSQRAPHFGRRLERATPSFDRPLAISGVPYGYVHEPADGPGPYRLGDQAAVIPSFCGDGLAIALHSGRLAAEALLRGESSSAYHRRMAADAGPPVRLAYGLYRLSRSRRMRTLLVGMARCWPGLLRSIARHTRVAAVNGS